ncbi:TetR/AcrR family transcriptional regulator [Chitinibacter tainanensis]|uniref:TetR/AcrR family transcriptional regulator n=1 Tax=Chitinibacter tainanensis TaxID=230667 RepID=UPI002358008C|nr:TetR/AcrR family transcriptional regulator [Chitinibacter tainanensis]
MTITDPPTLVTPPSDHRQRVAAQRRLRTRERLLCEAVQVFARQGLGQAVIGQIIQQAGVARGTFYNHFATDEALYIAVASEVSDAILQLVDPLVLQHTHPAARVACGINTVLSLVRAQPKLARFLDRGGVMALRHGTLVNQVVPRDLLAGMQAGCFSAQPLPLAVDLLLGPLQMAFHLHAHEDPGPAYGPLMTAGILRALGLAAVEASALANTPVHCPAIAPDSILHWLQNE